MRCVTWINGLLERNKPKRCSTCSLTEARMLLAVLSASMLRPVELSRMVSRSPSSVTGLCSGAGIPPVQNTHTQTHNMIWSPQALFWKGKKEKNPQSCTHIPNKLCACMRAQTHSTLLSQPLPDTHRRVMRSDYQWSHAAADTTSDTQTHAHACHMAQREKGCQCFMSVTVQINAIWPWDNTS